MAEDRVVSEEGEEKATSMSIDSLFIDDDLRWMLQLILVIRNDFRHLFGVTFSNQWGFFLDRILSAKIHSFLAWLDYPKGTHTLKNHTTDGLCALALSDDGRYLFTASQDGWIISWNLSSDHRIHLEFHPHRSQIRCVSYCSGRLASSSTADIMIHNAHSSRWMSTLKGHSKPIHTLSFNHKGDLLASGSRDRTVRLWSVKNDECLRVLDGHRSWVTATLFTRDLSSKKQSSSTLLISGSWDLSIRVWKYHSIVGNELIQEKDGFDGEIIDLTMNCDCTLLACVSYRRFTVHQWPEMDTIMSDELTTLCAQFHPLQNNLLAVSDGSSHSVRIYDVNRKECVNTLMGHTKDITGIDFTSDGSRLVSSSEDRTVCVFDLRTMVIGKEEGSNVTSSSDHGRSDYDDDDDDSDHPSRLRYGTMDGDTDSSSQVIRPHRIQFRFGDQ